MADFVELKIITSAGKFEELNDTLSKFGVSGLTSIQAIGCGVEKGAREYARDLNVRMEMLPKQLSIVVVESERAQELIEAVKQTLYTGHIGDGKIFVSEVSNVIRVRTGEEGKDALH